ncbi:MAG: FAD-dependent oxidoreductase [Pyrinomonadaceae bacterium]
MKSISNHRKRVAVVGGGVVGLTTALVLSREHDITVIAEHVGTSSDSRKATAIWHVYLVPETPEVLGWAQRSLEVLHELALNEPEAGVELVKGVELFRKGTAQIPTWSNIPRFFQMLTDSDIEPFNSCNQTGLTENEIAILKEHPVMWGYQIEAPAADMMKYLSWLEQAVRRNGVSFEIRRLESLDEIPDDYDVIINCSGFGARELASDNSFVPYKGQYFVLRASPSSPREYVGDDDHPSGMAYMIPRCGEVMVGGCAEANVEDLELTLDWTDTMKRAGLYVPWLRSCSPMDQARQPVVGIRPGRTEGVRLESDLISARVPIIHNYGHGGSGFSLSWGCADAVSEIITSI